MKISFLKIVFALVFCLLPFVASAGTTDNMSGWANSSNIGWISFNSTNCDTDGNGHLDVGCDGNNSTGSVVNYGVNKESNGNLVGYAWSSSIGWIKFGGFGADDFPTTIGTSYQNAQVVGNNLIGWARACSAYVSGCSGTTKEIDGVKLGGWDGWISLNSANPVYGVTLSGNTFSGYVWGGINTGWIRFLSVIVGPATPSCSNGATNYPTCDTPPSSPTELAATASQSCVAGMTGIINVSWASNGATSYSIKIDGGSYVNVGNVTIYPHTGLTAGSTHTYSVKATNSFGSSSPVSVTVTVPAACGVGTWGPWIDGSCINGTRISTHTCTPAGAICSGPSTRTQSCNGTDGICPTPVIRSNKKCVNPDGTVSQVLWAQDYYPYSDVVKWTCLGTGTPRGNDTLCSEPKGPGFREN